MVSGTPLYNLDNGPKDLNGELVLWTFCLLYMIWPRMQLSVCDINYVKILAWCVDVFLHQAFLRVLPFDQLVRVS